MTRRHEHGDMDTGSNDIIYGDYDYTGSPLTLKSGMGDEEGIPDFATGETWVS